MRLDDIPFARQTDYIRLTAITYQSFGLDKNKGTVETVPLFLVAGEGLEPTVLYFLCGENTAVGSAALTVHRTVIHYRLTLRVIRPRAHNPILICAKRKTA